MLCQDGSRQARLKSIEMQIQNNELDQYFCLGELLTMVTLNISSGRLGLGSVLS